MTFHKHILNNTSSFQYHNKVQQCDLLLEGCTAKSNRYDLYLLTWAKLGKGIWGKDEETHLI